MNGQRINCHANTKPCDYPHWSNLMKSILGPNHPNQVVMYDPEPSSLNRGDQVISRSAQSFLNPLFPDKFIVNMSTHQPIPFRIRRHLRGSDYSFVLGSNLLKGGMLLGFRQWNISLVDTLQIKDLILVGCGWSQYQSATDSYSKQLYRRILTDQYVHSVRDSYTKARLMDMGFSNVMNTGCPSLWRFTPEFCSAIPQRKARSVVTTVTDYDRDQTSDQIMLETLGREYDRVFVWPQGSDDYSYIHDLKMPGNAQVLPATMQAYDELLQMENVDYVGTRLHGGIAALQNKKRSLIVAIDNRAREMGRDFGLPLLERDRIGDLSSLINSPIPCEIRIDQTAIEAFLRQFDER